MFEECSHIHGCWLAGAFFDYQTSRFVFLGSCLAVRSTWHFTRSMEPESPDMLDAANSEGDCKAGLKGQAASEVTTMVPASSLPGSGSGGGSLVGVPAPSDAGSTHQEHRIVLYRPRHLLPSAPSCPSLAGSLGRDSGAMPKQVVPGVPDVRKTKPATNPQLFHVNCALPGCDKTVMRQPSKCFGSNSLEIAH